MFLIIYIQYNIFLNSTLFIGAVGLNNIKANDYLNTVLHVRNVKKLYLGTKFFYTKHLPKIGFFRKHNYYFGNFLKSQL